jgi:hypothetical protein
MIEAIAYVLANEDRHMSSIPLAKLIYAEIVERRLIAAPPEREALADEVEECPDITHARIVSPADRVPEIAMPTALRDRILAALRAPAPAAERFVTREKYEALRTSWLATGPAVAAHLERVADLIAQLERARDAATLAGVNLGLEAAKPFMRHKALCGIVGGYDRCACGLEALDPEAIARGLK